MKEIVYWLAKYTGIFSLSRRMTRGQIRILAYHGIWLGQGHFGNYLFMSPARFSHRLDLLARWGYPVLPLNEALSLRERASLPDAAVVITIDDGWYSSYVHMLPALERHGFAATMYVTTYYCEKQTPVFDVLLQYLLSVSPLKQVDFSEIEIDGLSDINLEEDQYRVRTQELISTHANGLDNEQRSVLGIKLAELLRVDYTKLDEGRVFHLMNTEELTDMSRRGLSLELHTHRHRTHVDDRCCLSRELSDNRALLEPITGESLTHFCYPSGVYQEDIWPELDREGITSATTTAVGLVDKNSHCYALPRILDGERVSDLEFEAELSGFGDMMRRLKAVFSGA